MQTKLTAPPPADDFLTATELCRWLKTSDKTLTRAVREGRFPPPAIAFGERTRRWSKAQVLTFLASDPTR